ncbi:MAG TPA: hypothetical protein PLF32_05275 [Bacteroidales bacterium]|nr:hypothetical protein [Bacteroidales bacterium]HOR82045.1 hypothetical protein [Bacteroidales bacterium]HPJ91321.1 hypothetical protein [Bacteroidales bacterium]
MVLRFCKLVAILFISSQIANAQYDKCSVSWKSEFCILENKRISNTIEDTIHYNEFFHEFRILDGDNYVFVYIVEHKFYTLFETSLFVFEIKKDLIDSFKYKDSEIINTHAIYYPMSGNVGLLADSSYFYISKGVIEGVKVDENIWNVNIDVEIKKYDKKTVLFKQKENFSKCDSLKILNDFFFQW